MGQYKQILAWSIKYYQPDLTPIGKSDILQDIRYNILYNGDCAITLPTTHA